MRCFVAVWIVVSAVAVVVVVVGRIVVGVGGGGCAGVDSHGLYLVYLIRIGILARL